MAGRFAIRRLRLAGLAPRDHPAPQSLEIRLAEAARRALAPALGHALADWSGPEVLRVRRLEVDIAMDAAFDPDLFATLLARAIASALRRASGEAVVAYATRAAYLAALAEALAAGRAWQCWWLREAEGVRALPAAAAIRTVLAADARMGLEALAGLPPLRLAAVLDALGPGEAARLLDEFSAAGSGTATIEAGVATVAEATSATMGCIAAVAKVASTGAGLLPLALYVRAVALNESAGGPGLAAAARAWAALSAALAGRTEAAAAAFLETVAGEGAVADFGVGLEIPAAARRLAHHIVRHRDAVAASDVAPACMFTRFGGLFLLVPTLGFDDIEEAVAGWTVAPDPRCAALIGYAVLGLCAGRVSIAAWLADPLWRELFGLSLWDPPIALAEQLSAIPSQGWDTLEALADGLASTRDARFLLPPRTLVESRAARRTLARLASAILTRFARRLVGFSASSAPFLWHNLLAVPAAVERVGSCWQARLGRPPLDVLVSLSRLAEGTVSLPSGATVRLTRAPP
jgi:hypothetical protein